MSLIVLSNTQEEYEQTGFDGNIITDNYGIQSSSSFQNHLTNVFKVPPNSEVALSSLKCSRQSVANIRQGGKMFSIYLGPELTPDTSYHNSTGMPIKCYVPPGVWSVEQLRQHLLNALRQGLNCHPDYWGQANVQSRFVLGKWQGFTYTWNCLGQLSAGGPNGGGLNPNPDMSNTGAPTDYLMADSWWQPCNAESSHDMNQAPGGGGQPIPGGYLNVAYNPANGTTLTQTDGGNTDIDCMFQYIKSPLSLMGGKFAWDPFPQGNFHIPWSVGLSRPTTPICPHPEWSCEELHDRDQTFYDYVCVWDLNEAGLYALFVYHAVNGAGDERDEIAMEQVKYWEFSGQKPNQWVCWDDAGQGAQITEENFDGTAINQIDRLNFTIENENVRLRANYSNQGFNMGLTDVINPEFFSIPWDDTNGATGAWWDTTFAPINPNKWYLYPKVALEHPTYQIRITDYDTRNAEPVKYSFPNDYLGKEGASWYARTIYGRNWRDAIMNRAVDIRHCNTGAHHNGQNMPFGTLHDYTRKKFETTTGNNECPDYVYAILPSSPNMPWYNGGLDEWYNDLYSSDGGNAQDILGFSNVSEVLNKNYGTRTNIAGNANIDVAPPLPRWVVHSANVPVMPTASTFVRLTGLTQQSFNFAKSLTSKIIYHFPRFDNAGNNSGPLYYEATEKTYLALNNAEELNITDLKVDIVNLNEEIVNDLQGTTIVVLHIRPRR